MVKGNKNKSKIILFTLAVIILCTVILSNINKKENNTEKEKITNEPVLKEEYIVEVGSLLPSIEEYYISYTSNSNDEIKYYLNGQELSIDDLTENNYLKEVNEYQVLINNVDKTILKVVDTTAPTVTLKDLTIVLGDKYDIKDFILEYKDNSNKTEYTITYIDNDNEIINSVGTYTIKLRICDLYNNCIEKDTKLIVNENTNSKSTLSTSQSNNSSNSINKSNTSNSSSNKTSNKTSNNSSNKSSNSSSNKTSNKTSNSSSNQSSNTTSNKTSNSSSNNNSDYSIDKVVEKKILKTETKYGTKITTYVNVTYAVYSDGSKEEISRSSTFMDLDYNGYNGTTSQLKTEAVSLYDSLEESRNIILKKTNEYRKEAGMSNLTLNKDLNIIATIRAIELAYSGKFDHTRPNGKPWYTTHQEYYGSTTTPFTYKGENLAYNYSTDLEACKQWRESPSHYNTMINKAYTKVGIGKYELNGRIYYVQEFGG